MLLKRPIDNEGEWEEGKIKMWTSAFLSVLIDMILCDRENTLKHLSMIIVVKIINKNNFFFLPPTNKN